jgi:hypothetical protein
MIKIHVNKCKLDHNLSDRRDLNKLLTFPIVSYLVLQLLGLTAMILRYLSGYCSPCMTLKHNSVIQHFTVEYSTRTAFYVIYTFSKAKRLHFPTSVLITCFKVNLDVFSERYNNSNYNRQDWCPWTIAQISYWNRPWAIKAASLYSACA